MNKTLLCAALAGVLASPLAVVADAPAKEKCYGVAKAGKNDCGSADGKNGCAGHSTRDNDFNDWKFVTKGECLKLGGSLEAGKAPAK